MRKTSLQQIIKDNQSKLNKFVATGLLATMIASFTSCDQFLPIRPAETDVFGNIIDTETAEILTDKNGNELTTEGENGNRNEIYDQRSQLFIDTRNKWASDWNRGHREGGYWEGINNFETKGLPFRFLEQEGVIYYNENGNRVAHGNEEFLKNDCLYSNGYIDPESTENDFYILMQYHCEDDNTVVTWFLKYTLDDDVYRDLLLLSGNFRANLFVQEIDQHYTPEVINKTVVSYRLLDNLSLTEDWRDVLFRMDEQSAYISNYNQDNLTLTVDYTDNENIGNIYSYTYHLKESPDWDRLLVGGAKHSPMSKEKRDALTNADLMKIKDSVYGEKLVNFGIQWSMGPSDEQKAGATIKYDFEQVSIDCSGSREKLEQYLNGIISYREVNSLTLNYVREYEKEHTNGK